MLVATRRYRVPIGAHAVGSALTEVLFLPDSAAFATLPGTEALIGALALGPAVTTYVPTLLAPVQDPAAGALATLA